MFYSIGGRFTEVSRVGLMLMLFGGVFYSLLLIDMLLSTVFFPNMFYVFCFGAAGGSTFLNDSLIFYCDSRSVRGAYLLLRL